VHASSTDCVPPTLTSTISRALVRSRSTPEVIAAACMTTIGWYSKNSSDTAAESRTSTSSTIGTGPISAIEFKAVWGSGLIAIPIALIPV
ncbi:uncharacterized protein METZ01_LOCUS78184, partial [marine metagenome]